MCLGVLVSLAFMVDFVIVIVIVIPFAFLVDFVIAHNCVICHRVGSKLDPHFKPQHCVSLRNSSQTNPKYIRQTNPKYIRKLLKALTATVKWLLLGPLSVPDLICSGFYVGSCVLPALLENFPFETWIISCRVLPLIQSYLFLLEYFVAEN